MSVTERWNAYLRRRADAQVDRANLAAMQHGLLPAGWEYGQNDKRQKEFDEQRRILLERFKHLYREPICGPDGVAIAIWYAGGDQLRAPMPPGSMPWPGLPPDRFLAIVAYCLRGLNRFTPPQLRFIVQAHAMSGPPAAIILPFRRKDDAASFAAELAQRVRASGVAALRQDVWPDPASQNRPC